jgi:GNAT superfamily N-acetyltransferase
MEQTQVSVRRSRTDDLEGFEAFVAGLSVETSTRRFFTPMARMPRAHARLLIANDPTRGSFLGLDGDRVVAHGCWVAVGPGAAEMALVVDDAAQRRGLGRQLTRLLLGDMHDAGMRRMEMVVEPGNRNVVDLIYRSWPESRPRAEDGLLTFVTPVVSRVEAGQAVA